MSLDSVPTQSLFATLATLESAHEPEQLAAAEARLKAWGVTSDEAMAEFDRRQQAFKAWQAALREQDETNDIGF